MATTPPRAEMRYSRRAWLGLAVALVVGAPALWRRAARLDRARRVRPEELSPIPWVGHA